MRPILDKDKIEVDWEQLHGLLLVLEPVAVLTTKVQKEQYVAGDLYYDLYICKYNLSRNGRKNLLHMESVEEMLITLNNRITKVISSPQFAAGLYMDPRYVHEQMQEELPCGKLSEAVEYIVQTRHKLLLEGLLPKMDRQPDKTIRNDTGAVPTDDLESPTGDDMFLFGFVRKDPQPKETFRERLHQLKSREHSPQCKPLQYWKGIAAADPEMATVAMAIFSVPITQVTVERAFSQLPLVITDRRVRLASDIIDELLIINLNKH